MIEHERCDACRFDGSAYDDVSLLGGLRSLGPSWHALLATAGDRLRQRPAPGVWSAIEYAAHSRDITALHVYGVAQALTKAEPVFPRIADDLIESAAATYADADADVIASELADETARLAQIAGDAGSDAWSWGITVGGSRSDVRRLLEHALHDSLHHLDDVQRGLASLRSERESSL